MTDPRYRPDSYETSFNASGLGITYAAPCPTCSALCRWLASPRQPRPVPSCPCTPDLPPALGTDGGHISGTGGDGDRPYGGHLGTPPVPAAP